MLLRTFYLLYEIIIGLILKKFKNSSKIVPITYKFLKNYTKFPRYQWLRKIRLKPQAFTQYPYKNSHIFLVWQNRTFASSYTNLPTPSRNGNKKAASAPETFWGPAMLGICTGNDVIFKINNVQHTEPLCCCTTWNLFYHIHIVTALYTGIWRKKTALLNFFCQWFLSAD
jgi:hypothetical protein